MSVTASRCISQPSALQCPVPIADGFALRWNNGVWCLRPSRIIERIRSGWRYRTAAQQKLIRLIATSSSSATLQIPIDR